MKPMVLDWALLAEVDSAVFVQMQPPLVIQNLHPSDSHTCETALCVPRAGEKENKSLILVREQEIYQQGY